MAIMKKLLGILVLGLLWCNIALSDLYDLKIDLNTSEKTTEKILIKDGYSSKCFASLSDTDEDASIFLNYFAHQHKLVTEIGLLWEGKKIEKKGVIKFEYVAKINQDGTIGKFWINNLFCS